MLQFLKHMLPSYTKSLQKKIKELEATIQDLKDTQKSRKIEVDLDKLVLKRNGNGNYSIISYCKKPLSQIIIATYKDADDEYAKNCTQESLEYLRRKI